MHRDIKCDNIIRLSKHDPDWKLTDYGFSKIANCMNDNSKRYFTILGTENYKSP